MARHRPERVEQLIRFYPDEWNLFCFWMDHGHIDGAIGGWRRNVPVIPVSWVMEYYEELKGG